MSSLHGLTVVLNFTDVFLISQVLIFFIAPNAPETGQVELNLGVYRTELQNNLQVKEFYMTSALRITLQKPANEEPAKSYYAIADIIVEGRCECYGHASSCACFCNGHATSCHYDGSLGYGVCDDCANHTTSANCTECESGYFVNPAYNASAGDNDQCQGLEDEAVKTCCR
nr:hypothetical protein BaRGS_001793 [Batillaria attramentaria]